MHPLAAHAQAVLAAFAARGDVLDLIEMPTARVHRTEANNAEMGTVAAIGLCAGTAVMLTGTGNDLGVLDRRAIQTRDCQPYHDAQGMPIAAAERHIAAAFERAVGHATDELRELIEDLEADVRVAGINFKEYKMSSSLGVRLRSHAMCHGAEGEMTRDALWAACEALGLAVHAAPFDVIDPRTEGIGKVIGPPWRKEHKLAASAALAALLAH